MKKTKAQKARDIKGEALLLHLLRPAEVAVNNVIPPSPKMSPFQRASYKDDGRSKALEIVRHYRQSKDLAPELVAMLAEKTDDEMVEVCIEQARGELWINDSYQVCIRRDEECGEGWPKMTHLSIKRLDKMPIDAFAHWRDLQEIKNMLMGPEFEAIELYPRESRRVDTSNQYHLWCLPPGTSFPFGFQCRLVDDADGIGGARQRGMK